MHRKQGFTRYIYIRNEWGKDFSKLCNFSIFFFFSLNLNLYLNFETFQAQESGNVYTLFKY